MTEEARGSKWGWSWRHDRCAHGPFDTWEQALADAAVHVRRAELGEPVRVEVGNVGPMLAADWVSCGVELTGLLDVMNDNAASESGVDEPGFDVPVGRRAEAEEALLKLLREWAEKYIESSGAWMLEDTKVLVLDPRGNIVPGPEERGERDE